MTKLKYPKDSAGRSIIGEEYGIQITKPWNDIMYKHNDKVARKMKAEISKALMMAHKSGEFENMVIIAKAINGYGYHNMDVRDIHEDAVLGLQRLQNHWLNDHTWPELVKSGLVGQISELLIGFKK